MHPVVFQPIVKQRRWGGSRLGPLLNKPLPPPGPWGESWEIADQAGDQSVVAGGQESGATLAELVSSHNVALFGSQAGWHQFPLLVKFLDVHDWLSLQVHPNQTQAIRYGDNGKTESWVVVSCKPGTSLYAGLKHGVTRQDFLAAVESGELKKTLNAIEVKAGDCIHIPAGTVHAIGPEVVVAEVQQQSDLTFRIHDWGRLGTDGKPRQLHIEEALECIEFGTEPPKAIHPDSQREGDRIVDTLVCCDYYEIKRHTSTGPFQIDTQSRFRILMVIDGSASLRGAFEELSLPLGTTALVPACVSSVDVCPNGKVTVLEIAATGSPA